MAFEERSQLFHFSRAGDLPRSLLGVFESARNGDFSQFGSLSGHFSPDMPVATAFSALTLMTYAAPGSALLRLAPEIRERLAGDKFMIDHLCTSLAASGLISVAELALTFHLENIDENLDSSFPYALSICFEAERFDLFHGPQPLPQPNDDYDLEPIKLDIEGYRQTVWKAFETLGSLHRSAPWASFRDGAPVDLDALAHSLLENMPKSYDNDEIVTARSVLEAFTGVDLSSFYRRGMLDRLSATIAVERLFDQVDLAFFKPGQRYFFGHPIPG